MKKNAIVFMMFLICFFISCKKSNEVDDVIIPPVAKNPPVINSFTVDKTSVEINETTTLRWNVSNAVKIELSLNITTSIGEMPSIGSLKIDPTKSEERYNDYKLEAFNADGSVYKTIQVVVNYPYPPDVEYRVGGTTDRVFITYANKSEGTSQTYANIPWIYKFNGAKSNQFLYVSAQNQRKSGSVIVEIYKNGSLYKTSKSSGAYVIATASGSY